VAAEPGRPRGILDATLNAVSGRPFATPELVIFDCDGVLVDTERIAVRVDVEVFAHLGWPMTEHELIERFLGRSDEDIGRELEQRLGRPFPPGWEAEFEPLYREAFAAELRPTEVVIELLDALSLLTCVASSGSHDKVRYTLGLAGLYDRFAGRIFSVTEVSRGKPAPDLFLHAASQMGVAPAACVVVEDSQYGVQAAIAAGMRAVGYGGGLTPPNRLQAAGAVVIADIRQLRDLLASWAVASAPPTQARGST
jgi:HAD superfamily hydrolase (TIGR01509 family)